MKSSSIVVYSSSVFFLWIYIYIYIYDALAKLNKVWARHLSNTLTGKLQSELSFCCLCHFYVWKQVGNTQKIVNKRISIWNMQLVYVVSWCKRDIQLVPVFPSSLAASIYYPRWTNEFIDDRKLLLHCQPHGFICWCNVGAAMVVARILRMTKKIRFTSIIL